MKANRQDDERTIDHGAAGDPRACARFEEMIVRTVRERAAALA